MVVRKDNRRKEVVRSYVRVMTSSHVSIVSGGHVTNK